LICANELRLNRSVTDLCSVGTSRIPPNDSLTSSTTRFSSRTLTSYPVSSEPSFPSSALSSASSSSRRLSNPHQFRSRRRSTDEVRNVTVDSSFRRRQLSRRQMSRGDYSRILKTPTADTALLLNQLHERISEENSTRRRSLQRVLVLRNLPHSGHCSPIE